MPLAAMAAATVTTLASAVRGSRRIDRSFGRDPLRLPTTSG
jgi:hypothetical protein